MGKFCSECGQQYAQGASQKFCGECGAPNADPPSAPEHLTSSAAPSAGTARKHGSSAATGQKPVKQPPPPKKKTASSSSSSDDSSSEEKAQPKRKARSSSSSSDSSRSEEKPVQKKAKQVAQQPSPSKQLYPFEVDPLDHCETSSRAHRDIGVVLDWYCRATNKQPATLRIYDPYYCDGAVINNMAAVGYNDVYNKPEDFYQIAAAGKAPVHDVLLTNPPYSEDHIVRCLKFCIAQPETPWVALLPNYVSTNDYYKQLLSTSGGVAPIYLVPLERYDYWMPEHAREHAPEHVSKDDGKTSPFLSSWYIWLGHSHTTRAYQYLDNVHKGAEWVVAKSAKGSKYKIKKRQQQWW